jgi:hypothetical protein
MGPLQDWRESFPMPDRPTSRTADGKLIPLPNSHQIALASFTTWAVTIPNHYTINDLYDPALWRQVELALQARAGRPKPGDLIRAIAADGSFDAVFSIEVVNRGYHLRFHHGRQPEAPR